MNRPITILGLILLVLSAVFYFADIASNVAIPLLIIGVIVVVAGILTGK